MSILPDKTIDIIRTFNDLAVDVYGISCILYVPNNLTALEGHDMYTVTTEMTYTSYEEQKVWIEWATKDIERLRKMGIFSEGDLPITAYFKNTPEIILHSYIKVPTRYIPDVYDTDEFEVVNFIMVNTYNAEVFRRFKMAPKREKSAYTPV